MSQGEMDRLGHVHSALADLLFKLGIEVDEVNPAYMSWKRGSDGAEVVLEPMFTRQIESWRDLDTGRIVPGFYTFTGTWNLSAPVGEKTASVEICGDLGSGPKNVAGNLIMQFAKATYAGSRLTYRNNR